MRGTTSLPLLLLLSLCASVALEAARAESLDVLQIIRAADAAPQLLFVASATFGGHLPRAAGGGDDAAAALRLVQTRISSDCTSIEKATGEVDEATAVLMDRGGSCSFVQKALAVQTAGASLLVVGDTVEGAFASGQQSGRPIFNCGLGHGAVERNASVEAAYPAVDAAEEEGLVSCTESGSCETATCVYTGKAGPRGRGFSVCCLANTLVRMGPDSKSLTIASRVTIPAVFASFRDAQLLRRLSVEDPSLSVQAFNAEENPWNVSMLVTWLLGVAVVIGGAYCSATDERRYSYEKVAQGFVPLSSDSLETEYISIDDAEQSRHRAPTVSDQDERLELSAVHALYFVVGSSSILVLLYYGHLALLMNVMFMVATTGSMTQIVVLPVFASVLPLRLLAQPRRDLVLALLSFTVAACISISWFAHRSSASIWPLQDLLCITLCFVVIDSIQLPSLRVATVLLGVAFAYDIFFVYVSPLIFGSSVMVDVASGGSMQASADITDTPSHEKLPMVLSVPLLFSYYGGNALLGLGDLILPGLLVSFCIRYDYCMGYPLSRNYFMVAGSSYAVGLLLANVMAVALRDIVAGQPALMYIVPSMLVSVVVLASQKKDLEELWAGPECLHMEHALTLGLKADRPPRREEVEPFLKKQ